MNYIFGYRLQAIHYIFFFLSFSYFYIFVNNKNSTCCEKFCSYNIFNKHCYVEKRESRLINVNFLELFYNIGNNNKENEWKRLSHEWIRKPFLISWSKRYLLKAWQTMQKEQPENRKRNHWVKFGKEPRATSNCTGRTSFISTGMRG